MAAWVRHDEEWRCHRRSSSGHLHGKKEDGVSVGIGRGEEVEAPSAGNQEEAHRKRRIKDGRWWGSKGRLQ